MRKKRSKKAAAPKRASGNLKTRAFGEAADGFGKEIVPLGHRAGALALRVGNLLMGVLEGAVTGVERVTDWLEKRVARRLKKVPPEKIVAPDPRIAVPAVQALMYSMGNETISEMFANLLAASMDADKKEKTHPAFVEMIKQMTPSDARVLELVSDLPQVRYDIKFRIGRETNDIGLPFLSFEIRGYERPELLRSIVNLERLGLIEVRPNVWPAIVAFEELGRTIQEKHLPILETFKKAVSKEEQERVAIHMTRSGLYMTVLGRAFADVCIDSLEKPATEQPPSTAEPVVWG